MSEEISKLNRYNAYLRLKNEFENWKSCDDKPEFDGMYLCAVKEIEPCNTEWVRHRIIQLHFNVWMTLDNQTVLSWMELPKLP